MPPAASAHGQRGVALVCALMLLIAAMLIGIAAVRAAFALMASARHEGERIAARAAAEAALRDAEHDIAGIAAGAGAAGAARAGHFAPAGGAGFVEGCGHGPADLGLCRAGAPPAWEHIDLVSAPEVLVPYGRFTGAVFAAAGGAAPARLPGYLIEKLEPAGALPAHGSFYRITAIGFGTHTSASVVLQAIYRKPDSAAAPGGSAAGGDGTGGGQGAGEGADVPGTPGTPEPPDADGDQDAGQGPGGAGAGGPDPPPSSPQVTLPAGRIGWREIANWHELHARARQ